MKRRDAFWNERIGLEPEPEKIVRRKPKEPAARPSLAKELSICRALGIRPPAKHEASAKMATRPLTFIEHAKLEDLEAARTRAASSTVASTSTMAVTSPDATSPTDTSSTLTPFKPHPSPYYSEPHASSEESFGIRGRSYISLDSTSGASYATGTNSSTDSLTYDQYSRAPLHAINSVKAINTVPGPSIQTSHGIVSHPSESAPRSRVNGPRPAPYPLQSVRLVQPRPSIDGYAAQAKSKAPVKPAVETKLRGPADKPLPRVPQPESEVLQPTRPITHVLRSSQRPSPGRSCLKPVKLVSGSSESNSKRVKFTLPFSSPQLPAPTIRTSTRAIVNSTPTIHRPLLVPKVRPTQFLGTFEMPLYQGRIEDKIAFITTPTSP
ncbi:hypothetical protein M422DRAFT_67780 [Sphaerobolus stellatus SS14]|uniref:Uncharacterized protein n=1 Tax=Sphaerobolus stellatus (strain SS14) TaxID=990650 RepID=A0A0C9ULA7_SPHS4|nr:hypothetical protein M422DRAFT_67780 [Sphaerobolus stellatus SS14]